MKINSVSFEADTLRLAGEVYLPEIASQPLPAICLCHGIPAVPYNPSDRGYTALAERFCDAGFVTMIFNFRGTGESQGNLDMLGWAQDLNAAIGFLYNLDEVNKSHICLLGSSGGAAASIYVAAHDLRVSSIVTLACPATFEFMSHKQQVNALIDQFRNIGTIRDKDFPSSMTEWLNNFDMISPIRWVDKISPRPLLLIHGEGDEVVPVEHAFKLYEKAGEPREIAIIPGAGHRLRLEEKAITTALAWIKNRLTLTSQ